MIGPAVKLPRSVFAAKLRDFPEFVFCEGNEFAQRRRWNEFFRARIGPMFDGRIIFEIGCSGGAFIARIAARNPHCGFVGLDWKCKAIFDAAKRVAGNNLRNIALLRGRGQDIARIFGDGEVSEIWLFHPDPCDREVEWKNRLFGEPFLAAAHGVLRDDASLIALKTDHPGYYYWSLAPFGAMEHADHVAAMPPVSAAVQSMFDISAASTDFWRDPGTLAHASQRLFANEVTAFEERFRKKRKPIFYLELRRKQIRSGGQIDER